MQDDRSIRTEAREILRHFGVPEAALASGPLMVRSPISGEELARLWTTSPAEAEEAISKAHTAFLAWREVPMPRRGELVRQLGEALRDNLEPLGRLVTLESGKSSTEGRGEVQEMVDICVYAAGLSRTIGGRTLESERPAHRLTERWHPLGVVGVISAFNFPVAVWSWNAALALVCGNAVVWKPSEKTPLTALAVQSLFERVAGRFTEAPAHLSVLLLGEASLGELLVESRFVPLVSATGSTRMGREVAPRIAARFGRALLELGGNNAGIVTASADLELALRAICFSAMGTAGQRCTTLRRLLVHTSVYDDLMGRLRGVYERVTVGDPRDAAMLVGPLIDEGAFRRLQEVLRSARDRGGRVTGGERVEVADLAGGWYVRPALVEVAQQDTLVQSETFAPLLWVMRFDDLEEAIKLNNEVPQGLSSSIFTRDLAEAERFLATSGSDCGIANVNLGPSGAEIGGAFGGEKETGGGRESGSDSWKSYMRRATNTVNYGSELPLAQGVVFDVA